MPKSNGNEPFQIDFDVELIVIKEKSYLVREEGVSEADAEMDVNQWWIPRSEILDSDLEHVGDVGVFEIPRWLAVKKGFVDEDDED